MLTAVCNLLAQKKSLVSAALEVVLKHPVVCFVCVFFSGLEMRSVCVILMEETSCVRRYNGE